MLAKNAKIQRDTAEKFRRSAILHGDINNNKDVFLTINFKFSSSPKVGMYVK